MFQKYKYFLENMLSTKLAKKGVTTTLDDRYMINNNG